jgi:hypothetical protein
LHWETVPWLNEKLSISIRASITAAVDDAEQRVKFRASQEEGK